MSQETVMCVAVALYPPGTWCLLLYCRRSTPFEIGEHESSEKNMLAVEFGLRKGQNLGGVI
jgi:hypothetical protein